jgi:hypothetical protein
MKNSVLLFIIFSLTISAFGQIVIDQNDMPKAGDTLRVSLTTNIPGDYTQAGSDMTWDFSGLNKMSQQVSSFVNVLSTPLLFQFVFIPGMISNIASPGNNLPAFPGIPFSNYFTFYKNSDSLFSDAGFAFQLSAIPIMLKYDTADVYYKLPCTMGDTWSSHSFSSISFPGLAYFSSSRSRTSQVDGWGSLTTPFGIYQTIRIKSDVIEQDSVFLDSSGFGFPYTRNITEYKWLGKGQGIPLLQINEEGLVKTAIYRDNINNTGVNELRSESVQVFPNPSTGFCTISINGNHIPEHIQILNSQGRFLVEKDIYASSGYSVSFDLSCFPTGLYMIRLIDKEVVYFGKVLIITH